KERLRARNLLRRWARALADPRHAWLSPEAPARNYEALLEVLTLIWLADALEEHRMDELLGEMWAGFIGSESRRGFLQRGVDGLTRPTRDPRLVLLARRAISLKKSDHVLLVAGDQRFLIRLGEVCFARIDEKQRASVSPISESRLAAVEEQGGTLADLLGTE